VKSRTRSRLFAVVMALMSMSFIPLATVDAKPPDRDSPQDAASRLKEKSPRLVGFGDSAGDRRLATVNQLATTPSVELTPCTDDPAWLCGSVSVPIDRGGSDGRTLAIGFQVFPHRDPASTARDAILVSAGGPGISTTSDRGFFQFLLDPLLDDRDLLLVDNRGTGTSAAIDCPELQGFLPDHDAIVAAVGACGAQLGDDADRYGSGDVALDIEAVRRTLGYPKLSYFAPSYGSVDAQAYAVRFPSRLRVIVADAGLPVIDRAHTWTWGLDNPHAIARNTALNCLRAPACAALQPGARHALADLARMIRNNPVDGTARDLSGTSRQVHVDELQLIAIATADILNPGELVAAAEALARGDKKPLLRLGAELFFEPGEPGDPAVFSAGDNAAAFCNDADFVWDRDDPLPIRRLKYARGLRDLGRDAFAPFSKQAWTAYWIPDFCELWPAPDRFTPAVPRGATVTGVPTLLVGGEIDITVPSETTRRLLGVFPNARFVNFAGALHIPTSWSDCAKSVAQHFIATLHTGNTDCAREPAFVPPAVPQFPKSVHQAVPAVALAGNASTVLDRRIVTVAVRSVLDGFIRSFRIPGATGTGYGLRDGTFDFEFNFEAGEDVLQLDGVRFSRDVAVEGQATLSFEGNEIQMELTVTGPDSDHNGTLRAEGAFGFGAPYRTFTVTGAIGGRAVVASVPAN
jgi:pimeloyl-ACP methyl ester carboxylesterase